MRDQAGHGSETLGARGYLLFGLLDKSVIGCLDGEDAYEPSPRPAATAAPICVLPRGQRPPPLSRLDLGCHNLR